MQLAGKYDEVLVGLFVRRLIHFSGNFCARYAHLFKLYDSL
jgi:hypothetical protein